MRCHKPSRGELGLHENEPRSQEDQEDCEWNDDFCSVATRAGAVESVAGSEGGAVTVYDVLDRTNTA